MVPVFVDFHLSRSISYPLILTGQKWFSVCQCPSRDVSTTCSYWWEVWSCQRFFYEQTAKWCSWHHEWHLRVFFLLCIHTPVTEKVLEFVQMEEYTSVFWSLWLNKHYWPTNKNDILIYFISCLQFNSCSERVWLCQLICTKSIPFLNYLKLLLPGILTLYLIAGCNFKCICSKNIPKPTLAAIRSTSLCIFFAITHQIWILVKKQIPKDIWKTLTSYHLQTTRNFGTFWFLIHYYNRQVI